MGKNAGKDREMRAQSPRGTVSVTVIVLMAVVLVALGITAGGLIFWDPAPAVLDSHTEASGTIRVTQQLFDDARTVPIVLTLGDSQPLTSPTAGRVTSSACDQGATVASGSSLVSVNGIPLVSLATTVPAWRDIARGDQGSDVEALTTELVRLGVLGGDASSVLGEQAISAWRSFAMSLGVPSSALPQTSIPQSLIVWLPAGEDLTIARCDVHVGELVAAGQPLATLASSITQAHIGGQSTQLTPGDRVAVIDDETTVLVDADGMITDSASLAALSASPTVRNLQSLNMIDSLTGNYTLSTPLDVSVVPPTTIVSAGATTGCILDGSTPRPVTVVASQLGASFVLFDDHAAPAEYVSLNPPQSLSCP